MPIQTGNSASVVPESDCIADFGFRVITLQSPMCTAVRSECSQDFRRSLCQTSCNRSPITFGTPAHMACVQVIPGAVIWRVSTEHLISDAKTLLQVLFWRAQHHSLGRKSRIDIFQSHMRQIAAPTVPVRTGEHEERESVGSVESRFPPPCRAMRWRRKAPKTAKIEPHHAVSGKVTHTPSSAPCPPQELQQERLAHWRPLKFGHKRAPGAATMHRSGRCLRGRPGAGQI